MALRLLTTWGDSVNFEGLGAVAQLGARLNGIQEAGGSFPPSSTNFNKLVCLFFWKIPAFPSAPSGFHNLQISEDTFLFLFKFVCYNSFPFEGQ